MPVAPFKLYTPGEVSKLADAMRQTVASCSEDWMTVDSVGARIRNVEGNTAGNAQCRDEAHWYMVTESLAVERSGSAGLQKLLLPHDESVSMQATDFRAQVLQKYLSALSAALDSESLERAEGTATSLERRFYRGSGWFLATLSVNGIDFECLVAPRVATAVLGPSEPIRRKAPLPGLRAVMSSQRVTLRAELGATTLTIGDIKQLAKGDVVALDSNLSQKMTLRTSSGLGLARGDLGASAGKKALKILPPSTTQ